MKLRVSHLTRYDYSREVSFSPHALYLRPRETPGLRVSRFSYNISPTAKFFQTRDAHDNSVDWVHFWDRSTALNIRTEFEIETLVSNPFDFVLKLSALSFPFHYEPLEQLALAPYLISPSAEIRSRLVNWLDEHYIERPAATIPFLTGLNTVVYGTIDYKAPEPGAIQSAGDTLDLGRGSARDFAVLLMELCRSLGFAARYVSGYFHTYPEDDHFSSGNMHAWTEVFIPGAGWKGLDATHGIFCNDAYIPVAHGAIAEGVNPVQGAFFSSIPATSTLIKKVLVEKID